MKTTTKRQQPIADQQYHPEYGRLGADVDLGIAMLIAETEDCQYQPIGPVATINEAREIARRDMAHRMKNLEQGGDPICPAVYKVWSRNYEGSYSISYEMDAATMKPIDHATPLMGKPK